MERRVRIGQRTKRKPSPIGFLTRAFATSTGAWIFYSNTQINHNVPLGDAIPAERETVATPSAGRLSYYVDRSSKGRPLLLLHSINAAASAYEMRPLFEYYRRQRPVYALDWSGYGFSERADRDYTPQFFRDALAEFIAMHLRDQVDVIALSLGCEFLARTALEKAGWIRSLVFISPSGLNRRNADNASMQTRNTTRNEMLHSVLAFRAWGRPLFDLIATRASIQYFLSKSFVGSPPREMIDYAYATSHQPGAEHVPLHFISGKLFTRDIAERIYPALQTPTLVIYDCDPYTRFDALPDVLNANAQWRACRVEPSLGLPHWEQLNATIQCINQFWGGI